MCLLHPVRGAFVVAVILASAPAQGAEWPVLKSVEAQPLKAQVNRLQQALDYLGQPLPEAVRKGLAELPAGDEPTTAAVQKLLDPLCLAAVEVLPDGTLRATAAANPPELVEQGWRIVLVKVLNGSGSTNALRAASPNARPIHGSPSAEVPARWLGLLPYTAQPLAPNLSGLGLEYTLLQLHSRDSGEKTAEIRFRLERGPVVRQWKFAQDTDGWKADNNCTLAAAKGSLVVTATGNDPYFSTPITAAAGKSVVRFWARFDKPGLGQVFWWTKNRPNTAGRYQAIFPFTSGAAEYRVEFDAEDELAGLRIDPGNDPGTTTFDWISLGQNAEGSTAEANVSFRVRPSTEIRFRVSEADGTPAMGCFVIRDEEGRVYPAQSKRLAPDFFFQSQVYRESGETVRLPAGKYTVHCSRGPESVPETLPLVVGDQPVQFAYRVTRWIDPAATGWWSGDHHIHAAGCQHYENPTEGVHPPDMMRHILGEDLKVGCCLTWGPCFDYQKRFFSGKPDDVSKYPYILRYDVEVSGFGSHASGHLNLLRLTEQIPPGGESKTHWPTLGMNTLRWAKRQGAVCGPAHSSIGLTRFVGRVADAQDGPGNLPNFNLPAYDGIGANEFVVDVTHEVPGGQGKPVPAVDFISTMNTDRTAEFNMWYHVLNCGFRVRASGETDFPCVAGERVGMGRVYAKVDGKLDFDRWVDSLAAGRSYVSDGRTHLLDFAATSEGKNYEVGVSGSEIRLEKPAKATFTVTAAARYANRKTLPVELIVNGLPVAKRELTCDGQPQKLSFEAEIGKSSWVAVRTFPTAHTNPFFVLVGGKPVRASKHSAQWCLEGVDLCWRAKKGTYRADEQQQAQQDYDHARKVYQRIKEESE